MFILGIETTGKVGSVAIVDESGKTVNRVTTDSMSHLRELVPMIKELVDELGISLNELDAIAVSSWTWFLYGNQNRACHCENSSTDSRQKVYIC